MEATGKSTKKATVEEALREVVRRARQRQALKDLDGLGWEGDLDEMRRGFFPRILNDDQTYQRGRMIVVDKFGLDRQASRAGQRCPSRSWIQCITSVRSSWATSFCSSCFREPAVNDHDAARIERNLRIVRVWFGWVDLHIARKGPRDQFPYAESQGGCA